MAFLHDDNQIESFLRSKTKSDEELQKTLLEKNRMQEELQIYREKEELEIRKKKEKQDGQDSIKYANKQWNNHNLNLNNNLKYSLFVLCVTAIPIAIGLTLRLNSTLSAWMQSLGNYQYIIWGILAIIFTGELLGRSYLFDKAKVKSGFSRLLSLLKFDGKNYKQKKINEFKKEYIDKI